MRASVVALLALAACHTEVPVEAWVPETRASVLTDTTRTRAEAAGLNPEQADALERFGIPVYVPELPEGWMLIHMSSIFLSDERSRPSRFGSSGTPPGPDYALVYEAPCGGCVRLSATLSRDAHWRGSAEGAPNIREVRVPGVQTDGSVRLRWSTPGEPDGYGGSGYVTTDPFRTDGFRLDLHSNSRLWCGVVTPAEAEALLRSIRPLDPADDVTLIGDVEKGEVPVPEWPPTRKTLGETARASYDLDTITGQHPVTVHVLRRRPEHAVFLVTGHDIADTLIREARARVVLPGGDGDWQTVTVGWQWRCQPSRGAQTWSAAVCG